MPDCTHLCNPGLGFPEFSRKFFMTGFILKLMSLPVSLCPHRRLSYRRATGTLPSPQNLRKPPCELMGRDALQ